MVVNVSYVGFECSKGVCHVGFEGYGMCLVVVECVSHLHLLYFPSQILSLMESVHQAQQHVQQLWQHKKMRLDQCFQLRLFEQDVEKVRCQAGALSQGVFFASLLIFLLWEIFDSKYFCYYS